MKATRIISAALLVWLVSCGKSSDAPVCAIADLYKTASEFGTLDAVRRDSLISADSLQWRAFLDVVAPDTVVPVDTTIISRWSKSAPVRIFTPAVDSVWPDTHPLQAQLGTILFKAGSEGLALPERKYAAVVWGNLKSILFVDNVMLIALNHYLGEDYEGYKGSIWPAYVRHEKTPGNLPYDMAEALVGSSYGYDGGDYATALSRMLYEGALIEAKMRLVKDATEAGALGYTAEQMDWFAHNERQIWETLITKKLIYDTSAETKARLVERAPATTIIAPFVPPRAGRYIGYAIVKSYLDRHPDTSLGELLSPSFYNRESTLVESGYQG